MQELKRSKKNLRYYLRTAMTRRVTVIILLALELALFAFLYFCTVHGFAVAYFIRTVFAGIIALCIVNSNDNPSFKIAWLVPLTVLPGFISVVYIFLHMGAKRQHFARRVREVKRHTSRSLKQNKKILTELSKESPQAARLANYIGKHAGYPVYKNTSVEYYKVGEEMYDSLLTELKRAEHFILLDFFIIEEGEMWDSVLRILLEKAKAGVDVRVLYDGLGSGCVLPGRYDEFLTDNGVKCKVFNRFIPFLSSVQNSRDHRKIAVIDGKVAFTGGLNIADEYINKKHPYGHWKDSAVMLKGDAVQSFTMMFFELWDVNEKEYSEYDPFMTKASCDEEGFVIPYGDCPNDSETVGKTVYLDIINKATDYIYITAPYLVIDNELVTALTYAAKSGVDVKIIVPGIFDKWYVHQLSLCYYRDLLPVGVKFYSYSPGFIHAKNFIADDLTAVVGSINTDFRSLYTLFEDAVLMYNHPAVKDVKSDFTNTLKQCREITLEEVNNSFFSRLIGAVLKAFGPLL